MDATAQARRTKLDAALWAGQWLLAFSFQTSGMLKLFVAREELARLPGALAFQAPAATLHTVGGLELAAALAIILPAATGIAPLLSVAVAAALAVSALLGALSPASACGLLCAPADAALALLALAVAHGRAFKAPIASIAAEVEAAAAADESAAAGVAAQLARARERHQRLVASCAAEAWPRPLNVESPLARTPAAPRAAAPVLGAPAPSRWTA